MVYVHDTYIAKNVELQTCKSVINSCFISTTVHNAFLKFTFCFLAASVAASGSETDVSELDVSPALRSWTGCCVAWVFANWNLGRTHGGAERKRSESELDAFSLCCNAMQSVLRWTALLLLPISGSLVFLFPSNPNLRTWYKQKYTHVMNKHLSMFKH